MNVDKQSKDRRTMAIIRHMRRSVISTGRPEITWKAGESELICLHGGLRLCHIGRMAKNFRADFEISVLHFCLSFPKSGRFVPSARKTENFCRYKK